MKGTDALYQQIYQKLLEEIHAGLYAGGKQLPTELEVSKQYYVSRITSKKALNLLAQNGLIIRIPGKGSFLKADCKLPTIARCCPRELNTIALVMGGYGASYGLDVVNGALDKAEELGLHLILKSTDNDQRQEARILRSLMDSGVAGIIMQPAHGELYSEDVLNAVYSKYPIVMIDRSMPGIDAPFVGVDNFALGRQATARLIQTGHRNIALLALGDESSSSLKERMRGFLEAFVEHRLPMKRELWRTRISEHTQGMGLGPADPAAHEEHVKIIARHLEQHPQITAVFATEYSVARAAWDAVRRIGRRVPQDISIVCFDYDTGYLGQRRLSHIKQPQRQIGCCAVEVLYQLLRGGAGVKLRYLLPGEWVEGNSVASPSRPEPLRIAST